jgi:Carboxypeptidase regulatory-like domain
LKEHTDLLSHMRIASPCAASWDAMEGDARTRFCRLCSLNVYDISELTRAEVEALVLKTEGRVCGRLTRRADGKVLTRDCPVGLRALRRRARGAAGAAFAALLSFCSLALAQTKPQKLSCSGGGEVSVEMKKTESKTAALKGTILDPNGAVVPNVEVVLKNESTKKEYGALTSVEGEFSVPVLPAGRYTLRTKSNGFSPTVVKHLSLGAGEAVTFKATLALADTTEVGIVVITQDDFEHDGGTTRIRGRLLTDLPIPREE